MSAVSMGIKVLVADVNRSSSDFAPATLDDGTEVIPFGLSAVRNVGAAMVACLIQERDEHGPYQDFYDFCERVDSSVLNKRAIESLIKAGGFDSLGHPRRGLLAVFEQIVDQTLARRRERDMGVLTLFGASDGGEPAFDERVRVPELHFDKKQQLAFEKEMLGLYVSDHPLMGAEASLRRRTDCTIDELREAEEGSVRSVGGVVSGLQRKWTKKGDLMAVFTLEDLQSTIEVMVFPRTMTDIGHRLVDDAVLVVKARVDQRDDQPKLVAVDVDVFEGATEAIEPLRIKVSAAALDERRIESLRALLARFPGDSPVLLHLGPGEVVRLPDHHCVDVTGGLMGELRVLFGAGAVL